MKTKQIEPCLSIVDVWNIFSWFVCRFICARWWFLFILIHASVVYPPPNTPGLYLVTRCLWKRETRIWSPEPTVIEVNPEQRAIFLPPHGFHWEFQHSNLTLLKRIMNTTLGEVTAAAETQFEWNKRATAAALNVPSLFYTRHTKMSCSTGMWISWSSSTLFICIESRRKY